MRTYGLNIDDPMLSLPDEVWFHDLSHLHSVSLFQPFNCLLTQPWSLLNIDTTRIDLERSSSPS